MSPLPRKDRTYRRLTSPCTRFTVTSAHAPQFRNEQVRGSRRTEGRRACPNGRSSLGRLLGLLGSSTIANAEELFQARLTGDQEVPAVETDTTGRGKILVNNDAP